MYLVKKNNETKQNQCFICLKKTSFLPTLPYNQWANWTKNLMPYNQWANWPKFQYLIISGPKIDFSTKLKGKKKLVQFSSRITFFYTRFRNCTHFGWTDSFLEGGEGRGAEGGGLLTRNLRSKTLDNFVQNTY